MTKEQIEGELKAYLGVTKVIWLPRGLYGILLVCLLGHGPVAHTSQYFNLFNCVQSLLPESYFGN